MPSDPGGFRPHEDSRPNDDAARKDLRARGRGQNESERTPVLGVRSVFRVPDRRVRRGRLGAVGGDTKQLYCDFGSCRGAGSPRQADFLAGGVGPGPPTLTG